MPSNTPKGYPYILPTDNVADYPVTSLGLANELEARVPFRFADGTLNIVASGSSNTGQTAVTFPAGLFTLGPNVVVSKTSAAQKAIPWVTAITATGCTIGFWTGDATNVGATTLVFYWFAIQATPTVALTRLELVAGMVGRVVTCHTDGCANAELAIPLLVPDGSDPDTPAPSDYACGVCGQPITDVAEVADISSVPIPTREGAET